MPDHSLTLSIIGARTIPSKPTWFHRLPGILDVLRNMEASQLDRQGVEQLFGVGERRARQLMAGLPGIRVGNANVVSRCAFEMLEEVGKWGVEDLTRNGSRSGPSELCASSSAHWDPAPPFGFKRLRFATTPSFVPLERTYSSTGSPRSSFRGSQWPVRGSVEDNCLCWGRFARRESAV